MAASPSSRHLRRAVELAAKGRLRVEPNPPVGCVIVKDGVVVGEGHHREWGGPHAEVVALRAAGAKAAGAVVYVTLEPCAHQGKTPPCSDALIAAGVAEVVYAMADPNPKTAGRGPDALRAAGVTVRKARTSKRLELLMAPYLAHLKRRRCWVVAKWAMTMDGRIASRSGDSKWVSGEQSRAWAHRHLRGCADGIMVGAGTLRADDPELTNRSARGRQPLRIVVCGRRPLPPRARLLVDDKDTLVVAPEHFRWPEGVEVLTCGRGGRVDVRRLVRLLRARGIERLLVEGGSELLGSFFDARLVDQVAVFVAPRIIGGVSAVPAVAGKGRARMERAFAVSSPVHHTLGDDMVVEGFVD